MEDRKLQLAPIPEEEDQSVLLSIGDLMSGLLMIFALLFMVVFVQYQVEQQKAKRLEVEVKKYEKAFRDLPLIVKNNLEKEIGAGAFEVDPKTGDLKIGDRILFDENSSALNAQGKIFLQNFIPAYSKVIFELPVELSSQVSKISIEGATSSSGNDRENMNLSLNRAAAVYNYIFNDGSFPNFPTKEQFKQIILVAGRGEIDANRSVVEASDRRVTFRFQVRRPTFTDFTDPSIKP